jgi:hypothetical protein
MHFLIYFPFQKLQSNLTYHHAITVPHSNLLTSWTILIKVCMNMRLIQDPVHTLTFTWKSMRRMSTSEGRFCYVNWADSVIRLGDNLSTTDDLLQPKTRVTYGNRLETDRQNKHENGTKFFEVQQKKKNNYTLKLLWMKFLNNNKVFAVGGTFHDHYK